MDNVEHQGLELLEGLQKHYISNKLNIYVGISTIYTHLSAVKSSIIIEQTLSI